MATFIDNYPANIEAPQRSYIQYSHDINFDYSTGKYPSWREEAFDWENYYIPIEHYYNKILVGRHTWKREKIGENANWSNPIRLNNVITDIVIEEVPTLVPNVATYQFIFTFEDNSTITTNTYDTPTFAGATWVENFINDFITCTPPLVYDDGNIYHLDTDGNRHMPSGGTIGQYLQKTGADTYAWVTITLTIANQTESESVITEAVVTNLSNTILISMRSLRYALDKYGTDKEWEVYFSTILDEVQILHEENVSITSIVLGDAVTVQYSLDNGVTWIAYTTTLSITVSSSRWRVSDFGVYSDGTIIIKGN